MKNISRGNKFPKAIEALAVVDKDKLRLDPMQIFNIKMNKEIVLDENEVKCLIEVKFLRYLYK